MPGIKLIMDLLLLINGFNNHVTVGITYSSCACSTNDGIHESNVSTQDWPRKALSGDPSLPQPALLEEPAHGIISTSAKWNCSRLSQAPRLELSSGFCVGRLSWEMGTAAGDAHTHWALPPAACYNPGQQAEHSSVLLLGT